MNLIEKLFKKKHNNLLMLIFVLIILTNSFILNSYIYSQTVDSVDWSYIKNQSLKNIQIDKNDLLANFRYSISLANLGEIEKAFDHFESIKDNFSIEEFNQEINPIIEDLDHDSNNILLLNYAAFSSVINSNNQYSIPYFKQIIDLEPENIWIRNFLAAAYLDLEKYDQAIEIAQKALEIQKNEYSHLIIAVAYYNKGNIFKAFAQLPHAGSLAGRLIFNN